MSIRKTAAASGEVLAVEGEGLPPKTAAADPGWREDDELDLAAENADADKADPPED
jgi:hypothetical protein